MATAHTADDQAETILHRIIRGTGIRGLAGMARVRPLGHATLVRPLLEIRRPALQHYLDAIGGGHFENVPELVRVLTESYEREAIRPNVLGRFRTMLGATARHPAIPSHSVGGKGVAGGGALPTIQPMPKTL